MILQKYQNYIDINQSTTLCPFSKTLRKLFEYRKLTIEVQSSFLTKIVFSTLFDNWQSVINIFHMNNLMCRNGQRLGVI